MKKLILWLVLMVAAMGAASCTYVNNHGPRIYPSPHHHCG